MVFNIPRISCGVIGYVTANGWIVPADPLAPE
jgi:hypothetical protein